MGGNPGEPSFPSPGHTRGYEINQAQSFDRTAGGMTAEQLVSGVAAFVGDGAGGVKRMSGRATHLRVRGEVCLGAMLYIQPGGVGWRGAAGVGGLTRSLCTEWVYVCACVLLGRRVGA